MPQQSNERNSLLVQKNHGASVATAHLSFPGVGHIRAENQGYTWAPVDYRWRT
jgi:hypothetical protein